MIEIYIYTVLLFTIIIYFIFPLCKNIRFDKPYFLLIFNDFFWILIIVYIILMDISSQNNEKKYIDNITAFRYILNSALICWCFLFMESLIFTGEKKKLKIKKDFFIVIINYGFLSINLFIYNHPDAKWPDIYYACYIIHFFNIILYLIKDFLKEE